MVLRVPLRGPVEDIGVATARLRCLLADLEAIEAGWRPGARDLAAAPILGDWRIAHRAVRCLAGRVAGHPRIGEDRPALTSDLWLIAPEAGYARTLSRFYRLE